MVHNAVEIRNLSKRFILRGHGMNPFKRMARRLLPGHTRVEHWALRNVDFALPAGETLALMGVNGSGKSTLLKIISQVMNPTSGHAIVHGRVGGMIELGAGFHPELTGFENIFLYGTLMGLPRQLIRKRLRAIEDFCELGSFLNAPVRHYSWGMFLRLGFAAAVHTDPDILIIDEALAVGDGYFQWKCMRKIEELQRAGKTIIFVSHLPEVAESLCRRAIWLHNGEVRADGPSSEIVQQYNAFLFQDLLLRDPSSDAPELASLIPYNRYGTAEALVQHVRFTGADGRPRRYFRSGEEMRVELDVTARRAIPEASLYLVLNRPMQSVSYFDSYDRQMPVQLNEGVNRFLFRVPALALHEGTYYATVAVGPPKRHDIVYDCHQKIYAFTVLASDEQLAGGFSHRVVDLRPTIRLEQVA
jgi:ABC-type polysaccharide/polyol phosphate transport system ATPase subunit